MWKNHSHAFTFHIYSDLHIGTDTIDLATMFFNGGECAVYEPRKVVCRYTSAYATLSIKSKAESCMLGYTLRSKPHKSSNGIQKLE